MQKQQDLSKTIQNKEVQLVGDLDKFFLRMDHNKDGFLYEKDIQMGLKEQGIPVTKALLRQVMDGMDINGDGRVSSQEFKEFIKAKQNKLTQMFNRLDQDNSGFIDNQELGMALQEMGVVVEESMVESLIERMDLNKDGRVSQQEFLQFYYLLPAEGLRNTFKYWAKSSSIDLGESMTIPDENHKHSQVPTWVVLMAGSLAGALSRTATAPLDRIKVLMQAQTGHSTSLSTLVRNIYREGGLRSFYRGNGTNVLKIGPEQAIKQLTYLRVKQLVCQDINHPTSLERLASGGLSGFIGTTLIYPLEITKTKLALSPPGTYHGIAHCIRTIVAQQGFFSLYRGWGASVLGVIPYASVDMAIFDSLRDQYIHTYSEKPSGPQLMLCGAISGITGATVSYPLALVRTRLQSQGITSATRYNGMLDCFQQVFRQDGLPGLYRGIGPNLMKSLPAISISYAAFEHFKSLILLKSNTSL